MTALAGPLHLVAVVLLISGVQKLVSPAPAVTAMRTAGVPTIGRGNAAGVALGAVEIATGLAALAVPSPVVAAWLATVYLALAGFVLRLRDRDASAGCGCFGASSAPPGLLHVVLNLASAGVAAAAAVGGVPDVVDAVPDLGVAVPYVVLVVTGAVLVLLGPALLATTGQIARGSLPRRFGVR